MARRYWRGLGNHDFVSRCCALSGRQYASLGLLIVARSLRIMVVRYFGAEPDVAHGPDVETPFVGLDSWTPRYATERHNPL